ncbi:MAG: MotA/TolQ/ExbB proton channel family protein [Myxococcales bacterium]
MGDSLGMLLRSMVRGLEAPALSCLLVVCAWALWEAGLGLGERLSGLRKLREGNDLERVRDMGRVRIERADMLARVGPMLGLVGTLIPLGPGLAALGRGELSELARAVTVAFDTTVLGLLVGMSGFVLGRLRRRWYDRLLDGLEAQHA